MTDNPTDRITEVLFAHRPGVYEVARCECGLPTSCDEEWAAHVAERVAEALQHEVDRRLTEAWRAGFNEAMRSR